MAARIYNERFQPQQPKNHVAFYRIKQKFLKYGTIYPKRERKCTITTDNNRINILAQVAFDPYLSTRQMARESGLSRSSIMKMLHQDKFHPYHVSLHQELHGDDFRNRIDFCQRMLQHIQRDPLFTKKVLFSDEATFKNTGNVNKHNLHYWADENPHWMRAVPHQYPWSLNVWCGIVGDHVIGPHFFDGSLTGNI
uniref:Transposase n=1 Tax=Cacopsylla melanoneura TaxID=428564 RepID=A0A8D8XFP3_9HEMI